MEEYDIDYDCFRLCGCQLNSLLNEVGVGVSTTAAIYHKLKTLDIFFGNGSRQIAELNIFLPSLGKERLKILLHLILLFLNLLCLLLFSLLFYLFNNFRFFIALISLYQIREFNTLLFLGLLLFLDLPDFFIDYLPLLVDPESNSFVILGFSRLNQLHSHLNDFLFLEHLEVALLILLKLHRQIIHELLLLVNLILNMVQQHTLSLFGVLHYHLESIVELGH